MLIDTHAHLNFPDYSGDLEEVIKKAREAEVERIINIGTSLEDSRKAIELAEKRDGLYATVGIHPNDNPNATVDNIDWQELENLARVSSKVVAIGECGLDFNRLQTTDYSLQQKEKDRQKKLFLKQIEIAKKLGLPLSIHVRDAYEDIIEIISMNRFIEKTAAVFHCFSGTQDYLEFLVKTSPRFYISFAGNITFKNAETMRELARLVPLDRLLVETDCPFLAPEPHRGSRNEPANVKIIASKLAEIKGISFEQIAGVTTENSVKLFQINQ